MTEATMKFQKSRKMLHWGFFLTQKMKNQCMRLHSNFKKSEKCCLEPFSMQKLQCDIFLILPATDTKELAGGFANELSSEKRDFLFSPASKVKISKLAGVLTCLEPFFNNKN